ncbi:MAG: VCBS repeat-containing protein [Rhodopirellula sp.]|nr:VCBS repeat-containing protein [Rhodopirellula sp.]
MARGRWRSALNHYSEITAGSPQETIHALSNSAHCLLNMGHSAQAEHILRSVLNQAPLHLQSQRDLANLLLAGGRSYEAIPHLISLIRIGQFERVDLVLCASPELLQLSADQFAQACLAALPDDPRPMLGLARTALRNKEFDFAKLWLTDIVTKFPDTPEAQARLGQLYLELGESENLERWYKQLPSNADESAAIWFVKAQLYQQHKQPKAATRCLAEVLTRFPDHVAANYQLTTALQNSNLADESKQFAARSQLLARIELLASDLDDSFDPPMCREMVNALARLGRYWEATAWCHIAKRELASSEWYDNFLRQSIAANVLDSPRQFSPTIAGILRRLRKFPLPSLTDLLQESEQSLSLPDNLPISFVDEAEMAGLKFIYRNGCDPANTTEYLFEFNGGGVGVLDFDCDGWPDLAFTQAGDKPWIPSSESDMLFRNEDGQRFRPVSESAIFMDTLYGQGITSGDINNDGFPDLYVANFGENQLHVNNGDGTFSQSPEATGGNNWTSSCAIADLSGDGSPEVYAVNYLNAEEVRNRDCQSSQTPRCSPSNFTAGKDAFFLNQSDGTFADRSAAANVQSPFGKGLGIVVADFNDDNRLDVFVGNDTTQNSLFINSINAADDFPAYEDQSLLAGVAFDRQGIAQACMGIAAASLNFDGHPDLFVTNFYNDANTLYAAQGDGTFRDESRESLLDRLSFNLLGFGTQFLDADLDGDLDLVVANGHIYRYPSPSSIPYRMVPQVLRNVENRFQTVDTSTAGPFFGRKQLGRSVARLDWNRDGLPDICISHLDSPVALLTNRTQSTGATLEVRLVGVTSSRDAIGARVTVGVDHQRRTQQLITGDGYQCRNEQCLRFAVRTGQTVTVVVDWPSGERTNHNIQVDGTTTIAVVEDGRSFLQHTRNRRQLPPKM